jgi:hypothetical protein
MGTTNLFVELVVIGVGAASWLALFALAALGYDPILLKGLLSAPAAALPGLVIVYLLGIVTDRLADTLLHFLRADRKRETYFATEDEGFRARGYVLARSQYFATQFDYSRSRQRICRGWILNAVLLAVAVNVFLLAQPGVVAHPGRLSAFLTPVLVLLALGCWLAWEKLADTELKRMRDQAKLLQEMDQSPGAGA